MLRLNIEVDSVLTYISYSHNNPLLECYSHPQKWCAIILTLSRDEASVNPQSPRHFYGHLPVLLHR